MRFFFFSSRRRHTRWPRDWSSDVCSSDLDIETARRARRRQLRRNINDRIPTATRPQPEPPPPPPPAPRKRKRLRTYAEDEKMSRDDTVNKEQRRLTEVAGAIRKDVNVGTSH